MTIGSERSFAKRVTQGSFITSAFRVRQPRVGSHADAAAGFRLDEQRLPDGKAKAKVLRAVERSKDALALKSALRLVRLSPARYHAWKRADKRCELDDRSSCPRYHPTQLTPHEVSTIKEMVTATEYRHMPLRTLALYAQRIGRVFASATSWAKLVRQRSCLSPNLGEIRSSIAGTGGLLRDAFSYLSGMPQSGSSPLAHAGSFTRRRLDLGLATGLCLGSF